MQDQQKIPAGRGRTGEGTDQGCSSARAILASMWWTSPVPARPLAMDAHPPSFGLCGFALLLLLRAVHVDAGDPGPFAAKHLDLRRAAGVALGAERDYVPRLRKRVGHAALRVALAADEALAALAVAPDDEVVPALGALAKRLVARMPSQTMSANSRLRLGAGSRRLARRTSRDESTTFSLLDLALRDRVHALLELGGHLVRGYLGGEVREGLGHARCPSPSGSGGRRGRSRDRRGSG